MKQNRRQYLVRGFRATYNPELYFYYKFFFEKIIFTSKFRLSYEKRGQLVKKFITCHKEDTVIRCKLPCTDHTPPFVS